MARFATLVKPLALLCACCLWLWPQAASARHILDLDVKAQPAVLLDWGDYLVDSRGDLTLQGVLAPDAQFKPTRERGGYELGPGQSLWIKFTVPATPDDQRWYLRLPSPGLDQATLYTRNGDDTWSQQSAGDSLPVSAWALPHLYPVLPLAVSAVDPMRHVLRIRASDGFNAPIEFVSEARLSWEQQRLSLASGVYFGLLAMGAIFALATSVALRDWGYFWFGLWATAATLTAATAVGIAGLHFWPEAPGWSDDAHYLLPAITTVPFVMAVAEALLLRERSPRLFGGVCGLAVLAGVLALSTLWAEGALRLRLTLGVVAGMTVAGVALALWMWWQGVRFARRLLLALSPMLFALPLQLGVVIPPLGAGYASLPIVLLALAITVSACYLLMALRSQEKRDHRRRIAQLDEIDPTTGLVNDTVYARRMGGLIERAQRHGHHSLAAVVDFPNLDQLRAEFGRKGLVELLLRLAERLNSMLRTMDTVARLGDQRFGLLIEGPIAPSRVKAYGAKVLAHCITPMGGLPRGMVVKPRIALALVPGHGVDAQAVLSQLDDILRETAQDPAKVILVANTTATDRGPVTAMPASDSGGADATDFQVTSDTKEEAGRNC